MIALSANTTALMNLKATINALATIDKLIEVFSVPMPGPAYVSFTMLGADQKVQLNRTIAVVALQAQREELVEYFATLGIDATA